MVNGWFPMIKSRASAVSHIFMKPTHGLLLVFALLGLGSLDLASAPFHADTNFFPLMAWNSAPHDLAVLKKMGEAGLTIAGFVTRKGLDNCRAAGLKALVSDVGVSQHDWTQVDDAVARRNL